MTEFFGATITDIFNTMPKRFRPEASRGVDVVIGYECGGEGGGKWKLTVRDQTLKVETVKGDMGQCTAVIVVSDPETFVGITLQKINAADALSQGRIQFLGDTKALTAVLPKIFAPYAAPDKNRDDAAKEAEELLSLKVVTSINQRFATGPVMGRWFAGLREKKLLANVCPVCKRTQIHPREVCAYCHVRAGEYVELGPEGVVSNFDHVYFASPDPLTGEVRDTPYICAWIMLDGASPEEAFAFEIRKEDIPRLQVGSRVRPVWVEKPSGSFRDILYFEIVDDER
jgi:uncharacterized OB-fold protein